MYMHFGWFWLDCISITLASVIQIARVAAVARLLFHFLGVTEPGLQTFCLFSLQLCVCSGCWVCFWGCLSCVDRLCCGSIVVLRFFRCLLIYSAVFVLFSRCC